MANAVPYRQSTSTRAIMFFLGRALFLAPFGFTSQAQQTAPATNAHVGVVSNASLVAPTKTKPSVEAREENNEKSGTGKPGGEGIKVHGHWAIVLKNPDGKVVERREFENSLLTKGYEISYGTQAMVALLSGNVTVSDPAIGFVQGAIASVSPPNNTSANYCAISQAIAPDGITCYIFTTQNSLLNVDPAASGHTKGFVYAETGLTTAANFAFGSTTNIVLSGNFTVPATLTSVAAVQTIYGLCVPKTATYVSVSAAPQFVLDSGTAPPTFRNADLLPQACANVSSQTSDDQVLAPFTSTTIPNGPLAVTAGQIITVTVTISFS